MLATLALFTGAFSDVTPFWRVDGAAALLEGIDGAFTENETTITVSEEAVAFGYAPSTFYADNLWTRDHAYVVWHHPTLLTAEQRQQFVAYYLSRRTTGAESDPDGGTLPADWIADRIEADGDAVYKNAGASDLPFMDGIALVVLALWSDWRITDDLTTYAASKSAITDCIDALPRSESGCVWSDPESPSVDYGFTDTVKKTGDAAYGTALLAWAAKMLDQMDPGEWTTLRNEAQEGLATLRQESGWYAGSSVNNVDRDDVWATALIVAEELVAGADRLASAQVIADAYDAGTITQSGWVKHLPTGQTWAGTSTTSGTYQNGGYWATPIWDCVRAVRLVDPSLAKAWAVEFVAQVQAQFDSTPTTAPYEWRNGATISTPKRYAPHAAILRRFA